jgi:hypothetical protein
MDLLGERELSYIEHFSHSSNMNYVEYYGAQRLLFEANLTSKSNYGPELEVLHTCD